MKHPKGRAGKRKRPYLVFANVLIPVTAVNIKKARQSAFGTIYASGLTLGGAGGAVDIGAVYRKDQWDRLRKGGAA